jgi:hypothetical protein
MTKVADAQSYLFVPFIDSFIVAIAFVSSQVKQLWTTQKISHTGIILIVPNKIPLICSPI